MELHILSLDEALRHTPKGPTYAIRILSGRDTRDSWVPNQLDAITSDMYLRQPRYFFDNICPEFKIEPGDILFDEEIARKIITDFQSQRSGCDSLVINCLAGINRSPAVGIALSEIFRLGQDVNALKEKYDKINSHIYSTMHMAAASLGRYS